MENTFQIITQSDLQRLDISTYVQEMILQGVDIERMSVQDLFQLINNLISLLSQVMIEQQDGRKGYSYSYKAIRKNNFQQIILVSGMLVFRLRQFLLQETIYYSLGATDERGQLFQRQLSQDELWQQTIGKNKAAMRGSLSQKAIVLSRSLERFNAENFEKVGKLNLWPQVLTLAFGGPAIKDQGADDGEYYQKDSNDVNVYVKYSEGRKKAKRNYYYKKGEEYLFYNQGWLYEWYLTYINKSEEHEQFLQQSIQNKTIAPIIYGMDNVAGITAGDFVDAQGRQVQAKFHNQKIISFTNILNILYEIRDGLLQLISSPGEVNGVAQGFVNMFTSDPNSVEHLNTTYNNVVNQLLSILKAAK